MSRKSRNTTIKFTALAYLLAVSLIFIVNACTKQKVTGTASLQATAQVAAPYEQGAPQAKVVSVMGINAIADGSGYRVIFRELAEEFTVNDPAVVASLDMAMNAQKAVKITFDPWQGTVLGVTPITEQEHFMYSSRRVVSAPGTSHMVNLALVDNNTINESAISAINTTTTGLTDVVPDMATAQLIFDYITHQSCELPGPYGVDFCITFQYCEDGCYARAHKMCYIINNRYHYATRKVFSFAYPDGPNSLCVKAEKWGGCCINWWYHVAPLVNIRTASGTKAYVFDPAMFDQPVLLATWLHAQQNPACAGTRTPRVTSYNIQPTASYAPADTSSFVTDPTYADTDTTLVHYRNLISCP